LAAQLLEPQDLAALGPPEAIRLPLELVDPNPRNPRVSLSEIEQLAASIADPSIGLLQPIIVRRAGERYEVIGGHRRLAAFRQLRESEPHDVQWRTIPAVVRTMDDDSAYVALLSAQVHSKSFSPREESSALEMLATSGRDLAQIGDVLHKSKAWVSARLRIYADAVLSAFVQTGRLTPGVAQELLAVQDVRTRKEYAERAVDEQWSEDRARGEARALRLDKQLREIARRAREMVEILSSIEAARLPTSAARDLWTLHNRIEVLARGGKPVFPTIEAARKAAGVSDRAARKPGKKRRALPAPA
jgi:ParB family chromosome partitioning protein